MRYLCAAAVVILTGCGKPAADKCVENLQAVHASHDRYTIRHGKEPADWDALAKFDKQIEPRLKCPGSGKRYRMTGVGDRAVTAACEPGSHPDGAINVLMDRGDVKRMTPEDAMYLMVLLATKLEGGATHFTEQRPQERNPFTHPLWRP